MSMQEAITRKALESSTLVAEFIGTCAPDIEAAALELAARFRRGGRLFVMGNGGSACDSLHVAVEFQHPIVEKRRALPAMALPADIALLTALGNDGDFGQVFASQLDLVAHETDAVIGISTSGTATNVLRGMKRARELGTCTIAFTGRDGGPLRDMCDHAFVVPSWSIHRIQEVHTVLLHLLWDHVHVALGEPDVL